jgi:spore coat polysaccharide biosynthesis protein SpsF (cytidylyltransferase family)
MNLALIQARMGSSRLPSKVLMNLCGKTVLEHVVTRVKESKFIDEVIVATTISIQDLQIVNFCASNNVRVFIGSEQDVLDRYYQAARLLRPANIIRITSDCPMIDPEIIDLIGHQHMLARADYSSNTLDETYPDGLDAEIFTFDSLEIAWHEAILKSDREHVTPYIKKNPNKFKLLSVKNDENLSHMRWTIDQPEDYKFLSEIYGNIYPNNPKFRTKDVLEEINKHPQLKEINGGIVRNEGYLNSLKKD